MYLHTAAGRDALARGIRGRRRPRRVDDDANLRRSGTHRDGTRRWARRSGVRTARVRSSTRRRGPTRIRGGTTDRLRANARIERVRRPRTPLLRGRGLPDELVEVPLELVNEAAAWLLDHDRVEDSQVGLFGRARVANSRCWPGVGSIRSAPSSVSTGAGRGNRTLARTRDRTRLDAGRRTHSSLYRRRRTRRGGDRRRGERRPRVARLRWRGPAVESTELTSVAEDRLEERDFSHEYDHLVFDDAGHAIRYPYVPTGNRENLQLGGTSAGYAEADGTYWPRALETLRS
ncbi:hypothetical protein D8S78_08360 [Natrialba swarupiae]|nr:hypothetical protein [Natrialba swarupiae]